MMVRIGLFPESPGWEVFCRQEGVPSGPVRSSAALRDEEWSAVIVTDHLVAEGLAALRDYLRAGGAILAYAGHLSEPGGWEARPRFLRYVGPGDDLFADVGIVDLDMGGMIPRGAGTLRTDDGVYAIAIERQGGGIAVMIPFDPLAALGDTRAGYRAFYSRKERLPVERVSRVAKGEVRHLLHRLLEHVHHERGVPYGHLWWHPRQARSVFAFRVDTDGASRALIDELYDVARAREIGFSWFLDVRSYERALDAFTAMAGQEHGVHCYEHRPFREATRIRRDLEKARTVMVTAGMTPGGVAGTFGIWTPAFGRIARELGFSYSSEFALGYDTLPFRSPIAGGDLLQVPIHPVCVGTMLRVGYSPAQMLEYFQTVLARKRARSEPTILYHHPSHRHSVLVGELCDAARAADVMSTTLGEYARWWEGRLTSDLRIERGEGSITCRVSGGAGDVAVRLSRPGGDECFVEADGRPAEAASLPWRTAPRHQSPASLPRIRDVDLRARVAQVYDMLLRRVR